MSKEIASENYDISDRYTYQKISTSPVPLGLASFALTTFLSSLCNAKVMSGQIEGILIGCAYAYGGVTQMIAGILCYFWGDDLFAATVFTSYGAFWVGFAYFKSAIAPVLSQVDLNNASGLYILCWLIFTFVLLALSFKITKVHCVLFTALTTSLLLLTVGHLIDQPNIIKAGGYCGFIPSVLAWYIMTSILVEDMFKKSVFPLGDSIL